MTDGLRVEAHGSVRRVVLDRPEHHNAVDRSLHERLANVWSELADDPGARAVVVTGTGRSFCAGGDLTWFEAIACDPLERRRTMLEARQIVMGLADLRLPLVAAVNGPAVGLGCSIALLADITLLSDRAFLADPHVTLGLVAADGGTVIWPLLVGLSKAKQILFLGDRIAATEAVALGLAADVVPAQELDSRAMALAQRLAEQPAQALQETKRALNLHLWASIRRCLDYSLAAESECFTLDDHRDAVAVLRGDVERA